jgi:hypothetical protein
MERLKRYLAAACGLAKTMIHWLIAIFTKRIAKL